MRKLPPAVSIGQRRGKATESRKKSRRIIFVCSCVVSVLLAVMLILEIINVLQNSGQYPFGSEFFGPYSIYKSQAKFMTFHSFVVSLLLLTFVAAWQKSYRVYWSLIAVIVVVLMYPAMTN